MYKISILSNPKNLAKVRKEIEWVARRVGFDKEDVHKIVLAVDEACTNIIRHSYCCDTGKKINIKIDTKPEKILQITIRDYGKKPDLKKVTGARPSQIKPGGLGVYFIRKIMDEVVYDLKHKKGTRLVLTKNVPLCK